ncbi:MAG: MFS transporter [Acidimicrobiales bacterium]
MSPTINHKPGSGAVAEDERPPRAGLILGVLILGAVVANINLGIANVALPSIGAGLDTTQAQLNLVALGFTLGLAASVLYLGALADRYGRKLAMLAGATLSIPAACLAAWAPNPQVLVGARVFGGVAAGMLYPTTLSLISALFKGGARTRSIALWSGIGGGVSALGPLIGGLLLGRAWWGSVFLVTIPLAVLVVIFGLLWIPVTRVRPLGGWTTPGACSQLSLSVRWYSASGLSPTMDSTPRCSGSSASLWFHFSCSPSASIGSRTLCSNCRFSRSGRSR